MSKRNHLKYILMKNSSVSCTIHIKSLIITNHRTDLSAATLSMVLLISGYWSKTALKWSTLKLNRLQYVSARTDATRRAFVSRQISPKYEPSLKDVATSPFAITMSTMPSWMKYIFEPIVPSFMMISPAKEITCQYITRKIIVDKTKFRNNEIFGITNNFTVFHLL